MPEEQLPVADHRDVIHQLLTDNLTQSSRGPSIKATSSPISDRNVEQFQELMPSARNVKFQGDNMRSCKVCFTSVDIAICVTLRPSVGEPV